MLFGSAASYTNLQVREIRESAPRGQSGASSLVLYGRQQNDEVIRHPEPGT